MRNFVHCGNFCMLTVQASCLAYFLGLQAESAVISLTLASVTGHLPMYLCLQMPAVVLSNFYSTWTDVFTGGSLLNCVQNLISTVNTDVILGEQSTRLTFFTFRHCVSQFWCQHHWRHPLGEPGRTPLCVGLPSAWGSMDGDCLFSLNCVGRLPVGDSDRYK